MYAIGKQQGVYLTGLRHRKASCTPVTPLQYRRITSMLP